jgi:glycosyltransferase involved in cell wall biosynthesis
LLSLAILGTRGIPAKYGGFETFAEQLATRLVKRGIRVTVYAEADTPGLPDNWLNGVRVRHIVRPKWGAASVLAFDCRCLVDAHGQHDIVYMLGYGAAWACWVSRRLGQRVWINVDGLEWARSKWGLLPRLYLKLMEWVSSWAPSRIIADAQAIADHFLRQFPRAVSCSYIAYGADDVDPNGSDPQVLSRWGLVPRQYVLVVARPEPENHVIEMIQGYLQSGRAETLVIVGDVQPTTLYHRRLLAEASDQVQFVGGVYDAAQLTCLRLHASCYLHGHSVGGTNPSLLEAMACGNLVIAHDNPFNREVARGAAFYFGNSSELAICLNRVMAMAETEKFALQSLARQVVRDHYTWDAITDSYEHLIRLELAGGHPG